jgi:integrase
MSVKEIKENNKKTYQVYVCLKSNEVPGLRVQKRREGLKSFNEAKRAEKDLYQTVFEELKTRENRGSALADICDKWVKFESDENLGHVTRETITDYYSMVRKWLHAHWDKPAKELTRADVRNVLTQMEAHGCSKSFQSKVKHTINRIYVWAIDENLLKGLSTSPAHGIKVDRKTEKVPEILTLPEIRKFLDAAKTLEHPWYHTWSLALLTGCRNGELYSLLWDDIDFDKNLMRISKSYNTRRREVKSTKAGYWRTVPINRDLKTILLELKSSSGTRKEVLPRLSGWDKGSQASILRTFLISIGLPSVRFHTLRACFATVLLQDGVAPATVMKICGWRDLDTMARYLRIAGIDESGATQNLQIIPEQAGCEKVARLIAHQI